MYSRIRPIRHCNLSSLFNSTKRFVRVSPDTGNMVGEISNVQTLSNIQNPVDQIQINSKVARQIELETEQQMQGLHDHSKALNNLLRMGRGTGLKLVQRMFLQWFHPFCKAINHEVELVKSNVMTNGRSTFGPYLMLLPPEKLAIITINTVLNSILRSHNNGAVVSSLSKDIADVVQTEFLTMMKLSHSATSADPQRPPPPNVTEMFVPHHVFQKDWRTDMLKQLLEGGAMSRTVLSKIKRLMDVDDWPKEIKVKLGSALLALLLDSAKYHPHQWSKGLTGADAPNNNSMDALPALIHSTGFSSAKRKRIGLVKLSPSLYEALLMSPLSGEGKGDGVSALMIRYLPMIVPPLPWQNFSHGNVSSPYYKMRATLIRTFNKQQLWAVNRSYIPGVLECLNYVNSIPWRINRRVYEIVHEAWKSGMKLGEIPSTQNFALPEEKDAYIVPRAPWHGGPKTEEDAKKYEETMKLIESGTPVFDEAYFKKLTQTVKTKNAELHSMRCDMQLKLWVAEKFLEEETIYFPHNLDFRGRAYPIPPNLNHLGSDLCRGLLIFAEAKPLGKQGLQWLLIHLCNLFGNNKISRSDRIKWALENVANIEDCAYNPLTGGKWWSTAESPFQALSACIEISNALKFASADIDSIAQGKYDLEQLCVKTSGYLCSLPVHQDGSCNGLQHYAALGRDYDGGCAVNLVDNQRDVPSDVYSEVLRIVKRHVEKDAMIPDAVDEQNDSLTGPEKEKLRMRGVYARFVNAVLARKIIKQTVMTSVYGVTTVGARLQVQKQLEDEAVYNKLFPELSSDISATERAKKMHERDKLIVGASLYLATLTLSSLSEMFTGARLIMDWLSACARLVAKQNQTMGWITPLGLPVMQPYRRNTKHVVKTILQDVVLAVDDATLPVSTSRQRSAFPPNFVHSLDATHMMLTSLQMKDLGLCFAGVHDSYWTHACDVPIMSEALRSSFVSLYSLPILEDLLASLRLRYPNVVFPEVPTRGVLDIEEVWTSPYFFH